MARIPTVRMKTDAGVEVLVNHFDREKFLAQGYTDFDPDTVSEGGEGQKSENPPADGGSAGSGAAMDALIEKAPETVDVPPAELGAGTETAPTEAAPEAKPDAHSGGRSRRNK